MFRLFVACALLVSSLSTTIPVVSSQPVPSPGGGGGASSATIGSFLVQTKMHLTGSFGCNHQLSSCFETRFARCFSDTPWWKSKSTTQLRVSVYQVGLPWEADNSSVAEYVTIILQLLSSSGDHQQWRPDAGSTTQLVEHTPATQCAAEGLFGGFVLLRRWEEPPPPGEELSENWMGIGLSVVFASVPIGMMSLMVVRRWRKIKRSDRAYKKLLKELRRGDGDDTDDSNSSSSSDESFEGDDDAKKKLLSSSSSSSADDHVAPSSTEEDESTKKHVSSSEVSSETSCTNNDNKPAAAVPDEDIKLSSGEHKNQSKPDLTNDSRFSEI